MKTALAHKIPAPLFANLVAGDFGVAANADNTKLDVTLQSAPSRGQKYKVKFNAGAVQDTNNIGDGAKTTAEHLIKGPELSTVPNLNVGNLQQNCGAFQR